MLDLDEDRFKKFLNLFVALKAFPDPTFSGSAIRNLNKFSVNIFSI